MTVLEDARSLAEVFDLDYPDDLLPENVEGRRRFRLEQVAHWYAQDREMTEEMESAFVAAALLEDTIRRPARLKRIEVAKRRNAWSWR